MIVPYFKVDRLSEMITEQNFELGFKETLTLKVLLIQFDILLRNFNYQVTRTANIFQNF